VKHTDLPHSCDDDDSDGDCLPCVAAEEDVQSTCRCGECCRRLILEALPEDALVEPRIKEQCEEIRNFPGDEPGYLLNGADGPCVFLDQATSLCTIYDTRPLMCRLFSCDGDDRNKLIELGILPPRV
jgi:Fe-S-cluster containining protein